MEDKKLCCSTTDKKLCGVIAGFADYIGMDHALARILYVVVALVAGWGILGIIIYIVAAAVMPKE